MINSSLLLNFEIERPAGEAGHGGNGFDDGAADALFLEYARCRFDALETSGALRKGSDELPQQRCKHLLLLTRQCREQAALVLDMQRD